MFKVQYSISILHFPDVLKKNHCQIFVCFNFPPSSGMEEGSDSGSISLWKQKNAASSWILTTAAAVKLFWVLVQLCYRESG